MLLAVYGKKQSNYMYSRLTEKQTHEEEAKPLLQSKIAQFDGADRQTNKKIDRQTDRHVDTLQE